MENKNLAEAIIKSWSNSKGNVNSYEQLREWIRNLNEKTHVKITETSVNEDSFWFYDDYRGEILNRKRSFFSITGMRYFVNGEYKYEQPIIMQNEIGFLGIIAKVINGELNFLMQAKIEPGNVNCVQISPTIQATKSNFTRAHGGKLPTYFEWFENAGENGKVLYDQIQSEQGSRFNGKRNRNLILLIDKEIEVGNSYKWMTLGQIKMLMKEDNLVNMDSRTVLSGIPTLLAQLADSENKDISGYFSDKYLYESMFSNAVMDEMSVVCAKLNDFKMHMDINKVQVPLHQLVEWKVDEYGVTCSRQADFCVRYYDIEIDGREVQHWLQPLFKAETEAMFVLFSAVINGERKYLVSIRPEIGCFDKAELGPSIQMANPNANSDNDLYHLFKKHIDANKGILNDVMLSEEGGRFYHEQNRNVIIELEDDEISSVGAEYMWVSYATLNFLCMTNNNLNIQLRSLMSLIDI